MTLKLQTDEVCRSFQLRRNGGNYIRSVVRTAIVASVVEPRSSAALRSAEFSRIIGNINATLLPALVGLSLGSLTTFVSALGLAALFGLPDVMRVSISAPGSSRSAPAATWVDDAIVGGPPRTAASSPRALPRGRRPLKRRRGCFYLGHRSRRGSGAEARAVHVVMRGWVRRGEAPDLEGAVPEIAV